MKHLKTKTCLIALVVFLLIPVSAADKVFNIKMTMHKNDTASIDDIEIYDAEKSSYQEEEGDYKFFIQDSNGETIWRENRSMTWFIMSNPPKPVDKIPLTVNAPYSKESEIFGVRKKGEVIKQVNLTSNLCSEFDDSCKPFCDGKGVDPDCTCGDGVCQDFEGQQICPSDCSEGSREVNESSPSSEVSGEKDEESFVWLYPVIGLLVALLLWLIFRSDL